jgi:hypothetical protein
VPEHLAPLAEEAVAAGAPSRAPGPLAAARRRKQRLATPEPLAPPSSPCAAGSRRGGAGSSRGEPTRRWWARCRRRRRIYGVQLLLLAGCPSPALPLQDPVASTPMFILLGPACSPPSGFLLISRSSCTGGGDGPGGCGEGWWRRSCCLR